MNLIDEELTREQFALMGPDLVQRLLNALTRDLHKWAERLFVAFDVGDDETIRNARHSIRGLSSNFGARPLREMAETELTTPEKQAAFRMLRDATLEAIRRTAANPGDS
jgi:HPt (histidine-containing phosphotransfer) domain-containing protein